MHSWPMPSSLNGPCHDALFAITAAGVISVSVDHITCANDTREARRKRIGVGGVRVACCVLRSRGEVDDVIFVDHVDGYHRLIFLALGHVRHLVDDVPAPHLRRRGRTALRFFITLYCATFCHVAIRLRAIYTPKQEYNGGTNILEPLPFVLINIAPI